MNPSRGRRCTLAVLLSGFICGCPASVPNPDASRADCAADDPRVGQTAEFRSYWHDIRGTARIIDNCTIVIDHFFYDGGGLDVRIVGFGDSGTYIPLTSDIKRDGGYTDETLTIHLPQSVTLDDVQRISVTCVSYSINFGDAIFGQ